MTRVAHPAERNVFVESVEISSLFGRYNYHLPKKGNSLSQRLFVLYGDNGSGKTTILFLLHHLLSRSADRGHKTAIAKIPFTYINVNFSNGSSLRAEREHSTDRSFTIKILRNGETVAQRLYAVNEKTGIVPLADTKQEKEEEEQLNKAYEQFINLQSYTLTDDRQLDSDELAYEYEKRAENSGEEDGFWLSPYRRLGLDTALSDSQLEAAIERADDWAFGQSRSDTSSGTTNVNAIYLDLLHRIGEEKRKGGAKTADELRSSLKRKVEYLGRRIKRHVEFGLEPRLPSEALLSRINAVTDKDVELAAHILDPYLDGVTARLDAQQNTVHTISSFIDTLNQYYRGKDIHFHARTGFLVRDEDGDYMATHFLSSGERQLLTIFCNVMAARKSACLFMIDEPEISLNIKWQRRLVQSLLECTLNSEIQLGMASHSFELLSAHVEDVVSLAQSEGGS
ncbi:AAA family ATPase [Streptomyces sp. NPDC001635]